MIRIPVPRPTWFGAVLLAAMVPACFASPPAPVPPPTALSVAPKPVIPPSAAERVAHERAELGVDPTPHLKSVPLEGPTPHGIPGGTLITTPEVLELLKTRRGEVLVFDVMGGPRYLPGAISLVPASQGGNFEDQAQTDLGKYLERLTEGVRDRPMVFYCLNRECWMSYNAALRAIRLGYRNVLWYRGGLDAWDAAELPTQGTGGRPSRKP